MCKVAANSRPKTSSRLADEIASEGESPGGQADGLGRLIQAWMDEDDAVEQRETLGYLVSTLDEDRMPDQDRILRELKGTTW